MVLEARDKLEQQIWWETKIGTSNVWFDNWTKLGALYYVLPSHFNIDERVEDVKELLDRNGWDSNKLHQLLQKDIVNHIQEELVLKEISSAWNLLIQKETASEIYKQMWIKGVPFKTSFFLWRLWKFKIPVDEVLAIIGINVVSRCCCCRNSQQETIDHLFLNGEVKQAVQIWWNAHYHYKLKAIFKAAPSMIIWKIWKWRNTKLHGGSMSTHKVIHEIHQNIFLLCRVRYRSLQNIPHKWHDIIDYFEKFRPVLKCITVKWELPAKGWFKCNSDGASRENPGPNVMAFCVRNDHGDLVYAAGQQIAYGNNLIAEVIAIRQGIEYYIAHQLYPLLVKTNSLAMKMFLRGVWEVPWCISTQQFNSFQELPSMARRLLNIVKAKISNLKIRYTLDIMQQLR
ncbi:uncharacterized protein LOC132613057 [Lycium barbarum]|uniref:uncharacterized protein LOC132613057 n=1 Tax=Lycium barbarum TaxID=112863 RepID=UPI00293E3021|nr:uncharacterized protein LOC132613057 [Lycium barbarum]